MASFQPDADHLNEEVDVYNKAPDHGYEDFSTEEGPCAEQPTPDPMRSTHAQASWLAGDPPQGLQSEGDFASSESSQLRQGAQISGNTNAGSGLAHRGTAWFTNADNAQDAGEKASSAVKVDENAHLTAPHVYPNRKFSYDPSKPSKSTRSMTVVQDPWHITLVQTPQGSNERVAAFCTSLTKIKSKYPHSEQESNPGMIWSRITQVHKKLLNKALLSVWVLTDWLPYQLMYTTRRLVEVVPDSITLATIQQERGIRGPLKDGTLKKWFHLCNKTAEDYEKALENFLHSCAGWCVVTFVLGICDRHNDNIMLKPTGHLFHIDFAKFLGHAQRFANIKRDRAPFIFTSEMHYFLTEGGRNPQRFQRFVDLCCQAYNIIRKHTQLFMSLLELMLTAGMPELKDSQDLQYVCNNLRPHESDLEATSYFTSKIKESLESVPVKLNFFIHSIAQGASIGRESKVVQAALNQTNRAIREASILGYCVKGTDILYSMQVKIENGVLMAEKTFSQFDQFHNNLQKHFVESALPQFPSWYRLSFTPKRRMKLLNDYLKELFTGPCRGKCPDGSAPDACVKTCLLPDPGYDTKKTTGVVKHNFNPTFNMLIEYRGISYLQGRVLKVTVKSTQTSIAATNIPLGKVNLNQDMWYPLGDCSV
ncbi:Phosphatidylinositol 4-phosphate 3-kinase C2 domain-containing subunit gamma [Acipenser ruthenus]|uniref:Phosphatidylinositol 4-phosphate 3-kinase C2 domain-containing subunit gamma n=1 Tax=Acipenser ruthenus TaxID=7906 RepID=A0A444UJ39_ACIRT|nr:Phosphatidylinositol 4-phosphate 3-kinase C2 domain-containing subunit gamma [Acipenser ruthenus]